VIRLANYAESLLLFLVTLFATVGATGYLGGERFLHSDVAYRDYSCCSVYECNVALFVSIILYKGPRSNHTLEKSRFERARGILQPRACDGGQRQRALHDGVISDVSREIDAMSNSFSVPEPQGVPQFSEGVISGVWTNGI
jgi:hypothetical protein